MNQERRNFLRQVMHQAWSIYRNRTVPGCNVRTFGDALRNAWGWLVRKAAPVSPAPSRHVLLRSMVQSPIRRSLGGSAYANANARSAGYVTSMVGA